MLGFFLLSPHFCLNFFLSVAYGVMSAVFVIILIEFLINCYMTHIVNKYRKYLGVCRIFTLY